MGTSTNTQNVSFQSHSNGKLMVRESLPRWLWAKSNGAIPANKLDIEARGKPEADIPSIGMMWSVTDMGKEYGRCAHTEPPCDRSV